MGPHVDRPASRDGVSRLRRLGPIPGPRFGAPRLGMVATLGLLMATPAAHNASVAESYLDFKALANVGCAGARTAAAG